MFPAIKRQQRSISVWPGYVDALSALLMVVIFVLLIFVFAQFLLSEILSGQQNELASLHQRLDELSELLGLERKTSKALGSEVAELSGLIRVVTEEKAVLAQQVITLTARAKEEKSALDRQVTALTARTEIGQTQLKKQMMVIASLQEDIDALRRLRAEMEGRIGDLAAGLDHRNSELGDLRDRSQALESKLAGQQERTLLAQKEIDQKDIRIQALAALVGIRQRALEEERELSASARAEVAMLSQRIFDLKQQLEEISRALDIAEQEKQTQAVKIEDLGKRLNIALARRVNELERYRSEFFGRMRSLLSDNPYIRIEGDRFVFQAELLFASGSAKLGDTGKAHLNQLVPILAQLAERIPGDINWTLRIDGHTDSVPINTERFASNWELSTARAVSVVQFLAGQGISAKHMAATGFGEFHPLDPADTPEAYQKNRRIEIKLTSR